MNKDIETWIKLLFTYGPFAILALFVFIIERRAWKALRESLPDTKKLCTVIYSIVWAVTLGLVIFTTYVWYRINIHDDYIIAGTLENLSGSEKIVHRKPDQDLYLCRRYYDQGYVSDQWRLITAKKLDDGDIVSFFFDRGSTNESKENVKEYGMKIRPEFYTEKVEIRYDRIKNKLTLTCGKIKEEILPVDKDPRDEHAQRLGFLVGVAHADEPLAASEFTKRLESDDPIIRRDARMELSKMGGKALPWIQKVLEDPKSSYRLRLGVITALGTMEQLKPENLNQLTLNAIIEASVDKDEALRGSALRFFGKQSSEALNSQVQQALSKAKAEGANPERISRLARAQLEILYNLGIREKDDYGQKFHDGKDHFQAAVKYFQDAWELHNLAVPDDRVYFTKALYGWGLALHDRSMIELSGGQRQPEMIKVAQNKFQEFIQAFEQASNKQKYLYPKHESYAKAYLENPVSQSLR